MTEEEYKFLEVISQRGTIPEPSMINYLQGNSEQPTDNQREKITRIFTSFQKSGFIDNSHQGVFNITELGKEKYRELSETRKKESKRSGFIPFKKIRSFRPDSRFWLASIIIAVVLSIIISFVIGKWDRLIQFFHETWGNQ